MSLLMQVKDLAYQYPGQLEPLFAEVSFSLYVGDKVALLGQRIEALKEARPWELSAIQG